MHHEPLHTIQAAKETPASAHLIIEKVRGKVEGTRKQREEVLPEADRSMTR